MDSVPIMNDEASSTIDLHFGEIAVLEANLGMYAEHVPSNSALRPMERSARPIKDLLLKLGSAFVETADNSNEIDIVVPISFTESELWTLRGINISAQFKEVPVGLELKKKIYSALLKINTSTSDFDIGDLITNDGSPKNIIT